MYEDYDKTVVSLPESSRNKEAMWKCVGGYRSYIMWRNKHDIHKIIYIFGFPSEINNGSSYSEQCNKSTGFVKTNFQRLYSSYLCRWRSCVKPSLAWLTLLKTGICNKNVRRFLKSDQHLISLWMSEHFLTQRPQILVTVIRRLHDKLSVRTLQWFTIN